MADEGLGAVAGAEDDDGPGGDVVGFEEEFDDAAAGHVDVGLEVPFDEAVLGAGEEEGLGFGDGAGFDFAAADGSGAETGGGDEHFGADVLRGGGDDVDEGDGGEGGPGREELLEVFPVMGHGHSEGKGDRGKGVVLSAWCLVGGWGLRWVLGGAFLVGEAGEDLFVGGGEGEGDGGLVVEGFAAEVRASLTAAQTARPRRSGGSPRALERLMETGRCLGCYRRRR